MSLDTTLEWATILMTNMEDLMGHAMDKVSWVMDHTITTNGLVAQKKIGKNITLHRAGEMDV